MCKTKKREVKQRLVCIGKSLYIYLCLHKTLHESKIQTQPRVGSWIGTMKDVRNSKETKIASLIPFPFFSLHTSKIQIQPKQLLFVWGLTYLEDRHIIGSIESDLGLAHKIQQPSDQGSLSPIGLDLLLEGHKQEHLVWYVSLLIFHAYS